MSSSNNNNNNKFIEKNQILNSKLFNQKIKSYDQVISVEWMIKNEYFELLKEKVQKGEYLTFSQHEIQYDPNDIHNIDYSKIIIETPLIQYKYSIFRQQLFDYEFYKNLFKNYPNYYLTSKSTTVESQILPYDNVIALDVMIKEFRYQPTAKLLLLAIKNSRFQIASYLHQNYQNITTNFIKFFQDNGSSSKTITVDLNAISVVPTLTNHRELFSLPLSIIYGTCLWIQLLSNQLEGFINKMNSLMVIEKVDINELNFDVVSLYKYWKYLCVNQDDGKFKLLSKQELNSMNFTEFELSSRIDSFNMNDERVEKLIKMILPFAGRFGYGKNFTIYQYKYQKIQIDKDQINLNVDPFTYGILDFDDYKCRNILTTPNILFKNIPNDIEKQLLFINNSINQLSSHASNDTNKSSKILNSKSLLNMVIQFNNLDYIKLVIQGLFNDVNQTQTLPINVLNFVKSKSVLDYILQFIKIDSIWFKESCLKYNIIKKLVREVSNDDLDNNNQIELLNHLKSNYNELYNEYLKNLKFNNENGDFGVTIEGFKFMYQHFNEFESCFFNGMERLNIFKNIKSIKDFQFIFNETPLITKSLLFQGWEYIKLQDMDYDGLSHWVITQNKIENNLKKFIIPKLILIKYNSIINNSFNDLISSVQDKTFDDDDDEGSIVIVQAFNYLQENFGKIGDLEKLEFIMKNYFYNSTINSKFHYLLNNFLTISICDGRIDVFKYLQLNYSWVFKFEKITPQRPTKEDEEKELEKQQKEQGYNYLNYDEMYKPYYQFLNGYSVSQFLKIIINTGNIDIFLYFSHDLQIPFEFLNSINQNDNNILFSKFYKKNKIMF